MLQTKVDTQCDKPSTELSWQHLRCRRFWVIENYLWKLPFLTYPTCIQRLRRCLRDPTFSRFSRTPICVRQTHDYDIYRAGVASRSKNWNTKFC